MLLQQQRVTRYDRPLAGADTINQLAACSRKPLRYSKLENGHSDGNITTVSPLTQNKRVAVPRPPCCSSNVWYYLSVIGCPAMHTLSVSINTTRTHVKGRNVIWLVDASMHASSTVRAIDCSVCINAWLLKTAPFRIRLVIRENSQIKDARPIVFDSLIIWTPKTTVDQQYHILDVNRSLSKVSPHSSVWTSIYIYI